MKDYRKGDIAKKLLNHFVKIVKEVKLQLRLGHVSQRSLFVKINFMKDKGFLRIGSIYIEDKWVHFAQINQWFCQTHQRSFKARRFRNGSSAA